VAPKETKQKPLEISTRPKRAHRDFHLPPIGLLDEPDSSVIHVDADALRENAELLTEKLAAYGVRGRVDEIHPGPVVTMYEFEPQSGTKVSKIAGLADDLAMALAAQKVRIVAPIAGKARVGFELPNEERQMVHLSEILEDRRWEKHAGALPLALGKDIGGQPVYADLARMPHLLVAGATGSGKSVALNVMLTSILAKKTPEEVRMLMIDPKVVELQVFDGIPHMLLPVVTDMKKAALALRWAVDEMERRYQLFADAGTRNIDTYNRRVDRVLRGDLSIEKFMPKRKGKVSAQDANGREILLDPTDGETPDAEAFDPEKLPAVVVVVDEFADLMMVAAKDVEACIARLAQKARAAGIHVILATQRPSVDVITGMIKANFPARVAFKVSQRQDSMTILGRSGAEHLLGMGDMLMIPPGSSDLHRVHAAFVSEEEVKSVCDFLREQGDPEYQEEILKPREDDGFGGESDDPLYDQAVAVVANAGYCSISHVQRQLSVGYNKAAKLVERMEQEGVVGPPSSKAGGRREVLVGPV
jgi:S-DNA-T family DNA segregation ATPase FtsK/SpoIIIE